MDSTCLPKDDSRPEKRAEQLADSRDTYAYRYSWPPGVAVAATVPHKDDYSIEYMAKIALITAETFKNALGFANLFIKPGELPRFLEHSLAQLATFKASELRARFLEAHCELAKRMTSTQPPSVESYGQLYTSIEAPPSWRQWDFDRAYAWQRVAGVNPMWLTRITAIPEHVAVGEREWLRAIGESGSLAEALANGRVFACDYGLLDGAPMGTTNGRKKWLPAPYAVFAAIDGDLKSVAIQVGGKKGSPVYTPADGRSWRIAKLTVQAADANIHEAIVHLGRTHMVMEAVALATHRQLAERHPLSALLLPHVELTLPINNSAATSLIAPGGVIDLAFAAKIETTAGLVKVGMDGNPLSLASPPADLARRGLTDPSVIAEHPYRDDGLLVWAAIERFAHGYVRRYYANDADVVGDTELAAWVTELGSQEGGRLVGVARPTTVAALGDLVAIIVWTGSAQHSAVNFTQFPYMGVMPNTVGALWNEWPVAGVPDDDETHVKLLPPYDMSVLQLNTVYQLSSMRMNRLGHYPLLHFRDGRVRE
ncbi:MAG: lipoxygenase family protein, partial [Polyangiales bacterium]